MAEVTNEDLLAFLKDNFNKVYKETYTIKYTQQEEILEKLNPTYSNVRTLFGEIESLKEQVEALRREVRRLKG